MMIKLKKLLKESKYAWDRKFGDPLPTFKDIAETHQNKPNRFSAGFSVELVMQLDEELVKRHTSTVAPCVPLIPKTPFGLRLCTFVPVQCWPYIG